MGAALSTRIFLTGGTGFFGKALLRYWAQHQSLGDAMPQVTLLSRDPDRFAKQHPQLANHAWLQLIHGDICDAKSLPSGEKFSHVLHAAADSTSGPLLTPQQRFDQIVDGTRNLLDYAIACGAQRFLLTSSGGVYGVQPAQFERVPEDCNTLPDPLSPNNAYSIAKRMAEHLCALYTHTHGIETVIARCFAFVGPDLPLDVHFAIGNFIRDALHADCIKVQGDGSPLRSYLDQRDLAHWLNTLLLRGTSGQAYNVGSDQAISIRELAYCVRDLIAPHKGVEVLGNTTRDAQRNRYIPSIDKARAELGLDVQIKLEDAIRFAAATHAGETP